MARPTSMIDAQCDALFASRLRRSDAPTAEAIAEAIRWAVQQFGTQGCAAHMAQEFGDHPEEAAERMRWIRRLAAESSSYRLERVGQHQERALT